MFCHSRHQYELSQLIVQPGPLRAIVLHALYNHFNFKITLSGHDELSLYHYITLRCPIRKIHSQIVQPAIFSEGILDICWFRRIYVIILGSIQLDAMWRDCYHG